MVGHRASDGFVRRRIPGGRLLLGHRAVRVGASGLALAALLAGLANRQAGPEVFGQPVAGAGDDVIRLNGPLPPGGDVLSFEISPDGRHAVFIADAEVDDEFALYSVPLDGGTPVRLNGPLPPGGDVRAVAIAPDGSRVVYWAEGDADGVEELYGAPIGGPAAESVKLNLPLVAGGDVWRALRFSPDGRHVVYLADGDTDEVAELFAAPVAGPAEAVVKLNAALGPSENVFPSFEISPDGRWVAYSTGPWLDRAANTLYAVPLSGPPDAAGQLGERLGTSGSDFPVLGFGASGSRVVFTAAGADGPGAVLRSVPVAGPAGAAVALSGAAHVREFQLAPDGEGVIFLADEHSTTALYSVPAAGPADAATRLSPPPAAGGRVLSGFEMTPSGERVVFRADLDADGAVEVHGVPVAGPADAAVPLGGPPQIGADFGVFGGLLRIGPVGRRVVYLSDPRADELLVLHSAPVAGPAGAGATLRLPVNGRPAYNGDAWAGLQFSPDGRHLLYTAPVGTRNVVELQSVPIGGPAAAGVTLNGPLVAGGHVRAFQLSPDGRRAVYLADQARDEMRELFAVPVARGAVYLPNLVRGADR